MASIGVSEIFSDPDFLSNFKILRRRWSVNEFGENVLGNTVILASGVVEPNCAEAAAILGEGVRLDDVLRVWYNGRLFASSDENYSDVIVFDGKQYIVEKVDNYLNWGDGYCLAYCVLNRAKG